MRGLVCIVYLFKSHPRAALEMCVSVIVPNSAQMSGVGYGQYGVCVTCVASAPVYACVVLARCFPPVVWDTGPPGALWETETGAEDLLERDRERERPKIRELVKYHQERYCCMLLIESLKIWSEIWKDEFCKVVSPFVFMTWCFFHRFTSRRESGENSRQVTYRQI